MIMLTSLAALALGAAQGQVQTSTTNPAATAPAKVEAMTQIASPAPYKPVWKPKPKLWPALDAAKPAAKLPAPRL